MRILALLLLSVLVAGMTSCGSAKEKKQQAAERVNKVCPLVKKPYLSAPGVTITRIYSNPDDGNLSVIVNIVPAGGEQATSVQAYKEDANHLVRGMVLDLLEQTEQGAELLKVLADNGEDLQIGVDGAFSGPSIAASTIQETVKKQEGDGR